MRGVVAIVHSIGESVNDEAVTSVSWKEMDVQKDQGEQGGREGCVIEGNG